jgi:hypothetical protein
MCPLRLWPHHCASPVLGPNSAAHTQIILIECSGSTFPVYGEPLCLAKLSAERRRKRTLDLHHSARGLRVNTAAKRSTFNVNSPLSPQPPYRSLECTHAHRFPRQQCNGCPMDLMALLRPKTLPHPPKMSGPLPFSLYYHPCCRPPDYLNHCRHHREFGPLLSLTGSFVTYAIQAVDIVCPIATLLFLLCLGVLPTPDVRTNDIGEPYNLVQHTQRTPRDLPKSCTIVDEIHPLPQGIFLFHLSFLTAS